MQKAALIMAGGRGERFWPRSRQNMPKQFLSLTDDGKTMIQLTVERILPLVAMEDIFIATNRSYKDLVRSQLPDLPEERTGGMCLEFLAPVQASGKDGGLGVSAIYVDQLRKELDRMLRMAQENVAVSFQAVLTQDAGKLEQVEKTEEYIDFLNKEISLYISKIISSETNQQASRIVSSCFAISGNIERIGDHADNICGYTKLLRDKHISFSPAAIKEIGQMQDISLKAIAALLIPGAGDLVWLADVGEMEQRIDDMTMEFRHNQLERMRAGACSEEACIIYAELLTDFERIGDHVLNIAQELALAKS